ncbi:MAG: cation:proton antiporter family protein [Bacteroidota bacterium]
MIVIWLGLAYVLGLMVQQIKLPPLIGYLLAGIALSFMGVVDDKGLLLLKDIGHYGVLILLFTVGLHLRLKSIIRPEVLGAGGIHMLISVALFCGISMAFGYDLSSGIIIGVLLGFSSTVLAAKSLEAKGELGAYHARVAIGILILQDIIAIGLIALTGGGTPSIYGLGLLALPLIRPLLIRLLIASGHDELELIYGLILAIGMGYLFQYLGLSSELGALVAGALLSGHEQADELGEKLWGLKEAFLVAFFMEVGLAGLPGLDDLAFIGAILVLLPVKAALFFFLLILFKLRSRNSFMVSSSLTAYSEFTLIAGAGAVTAGFIPPSVMIVFALVTAVSFAINAPLSSGAKELWLKVEQKLVPFERDVKHPGDQVVSLGGAHYLVVGMGQTGMAAYDELKDKEIRVTGMDMDPGRIEANISNRRRTVYGDATDPELWQHIDLSEVKAVMLAMPNMDAKVFAAKAMRENKYDGNIYALTMRDEEHALLQEAGANAVCLPLKQAGRKLAELSLQSETVPSYTMNLGGYSG